MSSTGWRPCGGSPTASGVRLLNDPDAELDPAWIDVYGQVLADEAMPPALKAYFLRIEEQPMQRQYSAWLTELVAAQERMKQAVGAAWREEIIAAFQGLDTYGQGHTMIEGITRRMLKSALLDLICAIDETRSHEIIPGPLQQRHHRQTTASAPWASSTARRHHSAWRCWSRHTKRCTATSAGMPIICG